MASTPKPREENDMEVIPSSPPQWGSRLRIEQRGPTGRHSRVWLNDMELTGSRGGLISLKLEVRQMDLTTVTLEIGVGELEVDANTVLALQAIVEAKRGR